MYSKLFREIADNNKRIQNIYLKTMENYVSFYKDFGNNGIINETNWE